MASESWPNAGHNSGEVTTQEWEQLAATGLGSGVLGSPSDSAVVYADGTGTRVVKIRAGKRAVVHGAAWYSGADDISLSSLSANSSGQTRIDLVVLRLTKSSGEVAEAVVTGVPGAGVPAATQDTGTSGVWELPIAQVTVENGATSLAGGTVARREIYVGEQPVIAASGVTVPHAASRLRVVDGTVSISDGVNWRPVWDDTGWVALTPAAGWQVGSGVAKLRRRNGQVVMHCAVQRSGSAIAGSPDVVLASLPDSAWHPAHNFFTTAYVGSSLGRVQVTSSGLVRLTDYPSGAVTSGVFVSVAAVPWMV